MNKSFSVYLDAVRFLAAMGVFASHMVISRWTGGAFPDRAASIVSQFGLDLVMVFFVLSGFVIAYTVDVKDRNWRDYAFSRATRMYSVAVPAIILGFLLDHAGYALNPADYAGWWFADHAFIEQFVRGLTFSNEFWRWDFRMGSNGPFWSLGYEVWYYVLFGVVAFARGWARIAAFVMIALLVGPPILLLAPVWVMGAGLYRLYKRGWFSRRLGSIGVIGALAAAGAPLVIYLAMRFTSGNEMMNAASAAMLEIMHLAGSSGRAGQFLWFWLVGALVTVHFAGIALLASQFRVEIPKLAAAPIRWLAGASFSIYVIHYPVLQALDALMVGETSSPLRALIMAVVTLAVCFAFASIFERRLSLIRGWLKRTFPAKPVPAAAQAAGG